jgi:hypothetical protein
MQLGHALGLIVVDDFDAWKTRGDVAPAPHGSSCWAVTGRHRSPSCTTRSFPG